MGSNEDCASVLETFMHDAANLPLEINHMMEEIQAKDKEIQKYMQVIGTKDGSIQKHVKLNGSIVPHPKEAEYSQTIMKNMDLSEELQDQKISLADKACVLLDRQVKRLDAKIKDLISEGLLSNDPPIPSLFNRKSQHPDSGRTFFANVLPPESTPLQVTSGNASHPNGMTQRMIQQPNIAQPIPGRIASISSAAATRTTSPAPGSAAQLIQRNRESSAGATDAKRRRLNATVSNMPSQSSNLRQSSLGPGTPKAGTPGSVRGSSAGPRSSVGPNKKSGTNGKNSRAPNQQVSKLKGKPIKRLSSSSVNALKKRSGNTARNSPSVVDDDSVLSSADISDADSQVTTSRRGGRKAQSAAAADENAPDVSMEDADDDDENDEVEQEDTRQYCFCHKVSYGEMVGCENPDCPYEWFHLDCVGLKKAPSEKDTWYCSECEKKGFKSSVHGK